MKTVSGIAHEICNFMNSYLCTKKVNDMHGLDKDLRNQQWESSMPWAENW